MQWKDQTSYSQNEKDRTPRVLTLEADNIRISVHRYIGLDGWFLSTRPDMFDKSTLVSTNIEDAKIEAIQKVTSRLLEMVESLKAE